MKVLVIGKRGGITNWEAEVTAGLRAFGHQAEFHAVRDTRISPHLQRLFWGPIAAAINRRIDRWRPDLILAVGGWGVEEAVIARVADKADRPPLAGWVGDQFDERRVSNLNRFDLVGYTDSAMLETHRRLGVKPPAAFIPHAADLAAAQGQPLDGARRERMLFVGNPTPGRRALVAQVRPALALYGVGWADPAGVEHHETHGRRISRDELARLYASHFACLNIRNEINVLDGLNQRNFSPLALGCTVVTDRQKDLALCFEAGSEILVYDDAQGLDALYREILAHPALARETGERGRRRVLADHTYDQRLKAFAELAGVSPAR